MVMRLIQKNIQCIVFFSLSAYTLRDNFSFERAIWAEVSAAYLEAWRAHLGPGLRPIPGAARWDNPVVAKLNTASRANRKKAKSKSLVQLNVKQGCLVLGIDKILLYHQSQKGNRDSFKRLCICSFLKTITCV
jgi:hypothetical protein